MTSLPVLTAGAALLAGGTHAGPPVVPPVVAPVVAPLVSTVTHDCAGAGRTPLHSTRVEMRGAVLCLLNRQRVAHGLAPLSKNASLAHAGTGHARDMVSHHYFAHSSRNGDPFDTRIRATGYMNHAGHWRVGENLGWGAGIRATPQQIVRAWMHSPPHRANILAARFTEIGVAVARGAPIRGVTTPAVTYATEFGART